jgi:hypothetical protein
MTIQSQTEIDRNFGQIQPNTTKYNQIQLSTTANTTTFD